MFSLCQRHKILLFLLLGPVHVDVVRAERIVRRDRDADRAVDARQLFDDRRVLDVAHARPAVLFGEDDAGQPQLRQFGPKLYGEVLRLVPLHDVRRDLRFGELAHARLHLLLLFVQLEFHKRPLGKTQIVNGKSQTVKERIVLRFTIYDSRFTPLFYPSRAARCYPRRALWPCPAASFSAALCPSGARPRRARAHATASARGARRGACRSARGAASGPNGLWRRTSYGSAGCAPRAARPRTRS